MPFPPPPPTALMIAGKPCSAQNACRSATVSASPSTPGTVGTPASRASCFARALSPISSIASAGGPTHVSPAASTARAKPAFSLRKP
jgi:hypothetical protein